MLQNAAVLTVYIILNVIVIRQIHIWFSRSFDISDKKKKIINIIFGFLFAGCSSLIMVWMPLPVNSFSIGIIRIGNYWLGFLIEFLTVLLLVRLLILLIEKITGKKMRNASRGIHCITGLSVLAVSLGLTAAGCLNAGKISVHTFEADVNKSAAVKDLKAVLIADTHLGYSIGCSQMQDMVNKINETEPDLVIFAGDMFDNNFDALDDPEELARILRQIRSTYGVYAVLGNHDVCADLVGGFTVGGSRLRDPRMDQFFEKSGITEMLDDTVSIAGDSVYLIGRIDEEESGDNKERKSLEELTNDLDSAKPLFVINHEPTALKSYAEKGVDILFSGHTHAGQTFPLNLVMPVVWDNFYGCKKIGDMYSFVTSGIGVYGPYMRVFTQAEIMEINIHFGGNSAAN